MLVSVSSLIDVVVAVDEVLVSVPSDIVVVVPVNEVLVSVSSPIEVVLPVYRFVVDVNSVSGVRVTAVEISVSDITDVAVCVSSVRL